MNQITVSASQAAYVGLLTILYTTDETKIEVIIIGPINLQVICQYQPGL